MKYYLINDSVDWADEFNVPFYELLDESIYRIYMYAKLKLGSAIIDKFFGTNEGWEYDYGLDLLQFEPEEITDIEYSVIKKHLPVDTLDVTYDLLLYLKNKANLKDSEDIYDMTSEQVMKLIDVIAEVH